MRPTVLLAGSLLVVPLLATLPHLLTMWRRGQAGGQSPLAWSVGVYGNTAAAYVALSKYGALVLAVGNAAGAALCAVAAITVLVLRRRARREARAANAGHAARVHPTRRFTRTLPSRRGRSEQTRRLVFEPGAQLGGDLDAPHLLARALPVRAADIGTDGPLHACPELHRLGEELTRHRDIGGQPVLLIATGAPAG